MKGIYHNSEGEVATANQMEIHSTLPHDLSLIAKAIELTSIRHRSHAKVFYCFAIYFQWRNGRWLRTVWQNMTHGIDCDQNSFWRSTMKWRMLHGTSNDIVSCFYIGQTKWKSLCISISGSMHLTPCVAQQLSVPLWSWARDCQHNRPWITPSLLPCLWLITCK